MDWTIGITTAGNEWARIDTIINSIRIQSKEAEIIIIGGNKSESLYNDYKFIPFDESIKPGWTTKKKNLIAQNAKNENLCIMHDYIALRPEWFDGFERFNWENPDWLTCTNKILNANNEEYRSWAAVFQDGYTTPIDDKKPPQHLGLGRRINPKIKSWGRYLYYSGAYYCIKKNIALEIPLDQNLVRFGGEDIDLSRRLYKRYGNSVFNFNYYSSVKFLKLKEKVSWEYLPEINFDYIE